MARHIEELVRVNGKIYEKINVENVEERLKTDKATVKPIYWYVSNTMRITQPDGTQRVAHLYGEKTWSYDEEEIKTLRANYKAMRAEQARRKAALTTILQTYEAMTTEELEAVAMSLHR